MGIGGEIDERARASTERHREPVSRNNEYIKLNPASTSNDHTNLYSDYVINTLNTNYTLSTVQ